VASSIFPVTGQRASECKSLNAMRLRNRAASNDSSATKAIETPAIKNEVRTSMTTNQKLNSSHKTTNKLDSLTDREKWALMMNNEEYTAYCYSQLLQVFTNTHKGQKNDKLQFRTEGLLQAGKLLGLLGRADAAALMDKAHLAVFGQTIEGRKNYKENVKKALVDDNNDFFNIPAYERRKKSAS
jgi:hypothetical protein